MLRTVGSFNGKTAAFNEHTTGRYQIHRITVRLRLVVQILPLNRRIPVNDRRGRRYGACNSIVLPRLNFLNRSQASDATSKQHERNRKAPLEVFEYRRHECSNQKGSG